MFKKLLVISIFAGFYISILFYQGCQQPPANNANTANNQTVEQEPNQKQTNCPPPTAPFPSYAADESIGQNYAPPEWYCREYADETKRRSFPIFQLSQNYAEIPAAFSEICPKEECSWAEIDFRTQPAQYMRAVLQYAYKGNIENDWTNPKGWYGAPFMHLDTVAAGAGDKKFIEPVGREFMRGLTMERVTCKDEINDTTTKPKCGYWGDIRELREGFNHNWAVSFYNARGASFINKVWTEVRKGEGANFEVFNEGFPDGTVSIKLLFTRADAQTAKYLENSVEWQADVERRLKTQQTFTEAECLQNNLPSEKCFPKVRLLQVDIAVKDKRAAETGWIFGTFIYNNSAREILDYAPDAAINRAWLRLEPVGLMFGNDPQAMLNRDDTDADDGRILQSLNNSFITVRQHLGCGGRLSGPVDSPSSSCLSCHAFSQTPDNLNPDSVRYAEMKCETNADVTKLFRNIKPPGVIPVSGYGGKIFSLDYSLQLREGIFRYWLETNKCYQSEDDLRRCFGSKNETSKENPVAKQDAIKTTLDRGGLEKVQ